MKHVMRKAVPGSVHKVRFNKNACGAALALALCSTAGAAELTFGTLDSGLGDGKQWSLGPATVTVKGAVSAGMVVRTDTPHYSSGDGMNTQNDGELNYDKGDTASQALEAYLQADIKVDDAGLFVSGKGWYDYALKHDNVAHGSVANGYSANSPLSDNGFVPLDRFSNAVLDDLYVYNTFHFGDQSLLVRLGNQEIPWVTPTTIGGGIQQINSIDYSALSRASSIAEEAAVPAPTLYARYTVNPALSFDAFYIFRFEPNAYPGCGTFWSTSDYAQQGCDKMTLNGALLSAITHKSVSTTDAQSITNPLDYVARGADKKKSNKGQYGGSVSVMFDNVGLFGLYYAHYSSRSAVTGDVRTGAGVLTPTAATWAWPHRPASPATTNASTRPISICSRSISKHACRTAPACIANSAIAPISRLPGTAPTLSPACWPAPARWHGWPKRQSAMRRAAMTISKWRNGISARPNRWGTGTVASCRCRAKRPSNTWRACQIVM